MSETNEKPAEPVAKLKKAPVRIRLTDAAIMKLEVPAKGYSIVTDHPPEARGFAVRVTANGARSFVLNYYIAGRDRCITIGRFPEWKTGEARKEAVALRSQIAKGTDPMEEAEEQRAAPTVADLIDRFFEEHLPRKRESTAREYRRTLDNYVRPHLGRHKVADVTFAHIDALHRKITRDGAPYVANRCVAILSKMFSMSVRWQWRTDNPCKGIDRNVEHHRRRYLSSDELARLVAALAAYPDRQVADAVRILMLTGARRSEVLGMRWADIDLGNGVWSKPPSSTKQNQHHSVFLSGPVRALLGRVHEEQSAQRRPVGAFVFPSTGASGHLVEIKKGWATITKSAGIENLRLHDLRHSFASALVSAGASLELVGAMLGHANTSTTSRYSHMYDDPQRLAAEKIGALIENAGKVTPDNLVPLRQK